MPTIEICLVFRSISKSLALARLKGGGDLVIHFP